MTPAAPRKSAGRAQAHSEKATDRANGHCCSPQRSPTYLRSLASALARTLTLSHSEFRKIHQEFSEIFRNLRDSQHFLKYSAKFREIFVRIGAKFDEKVLKTSDFTEMKFKQNFEKTFDDFLLKF